MAVSEDKNYCVYLLVTTTFIWHEFGVKTVALVKFNKSSLIPRVALEKMLGKDN